MPGAFFGRMHQEVGIQLFLLGHCHLRLSKQCHQRTATYHFLSAQMTRAQNNCRKLHLVFGLLLFPSLLNVLGLKIIPHDSLSQKTPLLQHSLEKYIPPR